MASLRKGFSLLRGKLEQFLNPVVFVSVALPGAYVLYIDYSRYPRMARTYERGNILPPFKENQFEVKFFERKTVSENVKNMLKSKFTNSYYLVNGEIGSGKTRTLIELTRELMKTSGPLQKGAPIYVSCSQGKCLGDTLAEAVNFRFDEHIRLSSFVKYALKIRSFPGRDDHNKLLRVLDAIEESAFIYLQKNGKPVVLVIDSIGMLEDSEHSIGLRKLQDKAKLWADTNTVKVVFVTNELNTELVLQDHQSNWSRAATPITIGDLSENEAVAYLATPGLLEAEDQESKARGINAVAAKDIYSQVGGRMRHLIACKRGYMDSKPLAVILDGLRDKEREKFLHKENNHPMWKVIAMLNDSPNKTVSLINLISSSSKEDVLHLAKAHIVKVQRNVNGFVVKFESVLTERVADELCQQLNIGLGVSSVMNDEHLASES